MTGKRIALKGLIAVVGIAMLYFAYDSYAGLSRVKSYGKTAVVEPIAGYNRHKSRGGTTYTSTFTFTTETGGKVTLKRSFPEQLIGDFEAGRPVTVYYNPRTPAEFVFEKETPSWWLGGLGIGAIVVALLFL